MLSLWANFLSLRAHNSKVNDPIQLEIDLDRDFMPVLVMCKNEADRIKAEAATVMTTFCPY